METRVSLYVVIDNESCKATIRSNVSIWDDAELKYNASSAVLDSMERPVELEHSVLPYTVAVLRNSSDQVVAHLLDRIAAGETLTLHEVHHTPMM